MSCSNYLAVRALAAQDRGSGFDLLVATRSFAISFTASCQPIICVIPGCPTWRGPENGSSCNGYCLGQCDWDCGGHARPSHRAQTGMDEEAV